MCGNNEPINSTDYSIDFKVFKTDIFNSLKLGLIIYENRRTL